MFDFFEQSEDTVVIAFGDSSGKGAAAALYGSLVSGLLRSLAPRSKRPSELMKRLNQILLERKVDAQYATLTILLWESAARTLRIANAGAEPPLICRLGEIIQPQIEGIPIGLLDDREYDEIVFQAQPGDVLFLFSDGLEDQLNAADQQFGRARLAVALKKLCALDPRGLVDGVFDELDQYMDGTPITDDQTAIAIRVS